MLSREAIEPDAQQLLEVLLDQAVQRGLARPSGPVDLTADLHTSRPAGGTSFGENRRAIHPLETRPERARASLHRRRIWDIAYAILSLLLRSRFVLLMAACLSIATFAAA